MFWSGFLVGVLVGGACGILAAALCAAARRGEFNGNDKDL